MIRSLIALIAVYCTRQSRAPKQCCEASYVLALKGVCDTDGWADGRYQVHCLPASLSYTVDKYLYGQKLLESKVSQVVFVPMGAMTSDFGVREFAQHDVILLFKGSVFHCGLAELLYDLWNPTS